MAESNASAQAVVVLLFPAMDELIFCGTVLTPIDNPAQHFKPNYDYGLELMLNAAWYLIHTYGRSQEAPAIDLLMQVSRNVPISLEFQLPDRRP